MPYNGFGVESECIVEALGEIGLVTLLFVFETEELV